MGNCGGSPKTNEGEEIPVPAPVVVEEVLKVQDNNSLITQNGEATKVEESKSEEVKVEGKEEKKAEKEDAKPETKEQK
ncbi:hypothetical protein TanjilG_07960 [Lupinus angustifolius]|uniref:Uncharacterized protein n=1 Tax=Lupinus angustifolius TaxID=3871 RepID=A0A4P1RLH1_LUPAN|nr:hypothetical protein TanjilG_07960 [Lupinus angustifolius]